MYQPSSTPGRCGSVPLLNWVEDVAHCDLSSCKCFLCTHDDTHSRLFLLLKVRRSDSQHPKCQIQKQPCCWLEITEKKRKD